jgi:hypothetical protein
LVIPAAAIVIIVDLHLESHQVTDRRRPSVQIENGPGKFRLQSIPGVGSQEGEDDALYGVPVIHPDCRCCGIPGKTILVVISTRGIGSRLVIIDVNEYLYTVIIILSRRIADQRVIIYIDENVEIL